MRCPGTPGTSRACGPTQPSGSRSPYRPPPQQHQPCTPKESVHALRSGLTRPASSPPSPSQAQVPPSACSPRVPGVRKGWQTLTWGRRVSLSLFQGLCSPGPWSRGNLNFQLIFYFLNLFLTFRHRSFIYIVPFSLTALPLQSSL